MIKIKQKRQKTQRVCITDKLKLAIDELKQELKEEKDDSERFSLLVAILSLPTEHQSVLIERVKNSKDSILADLASKIVVNSNKQENVTLDEAQNALFCANTGYYQRAYKEKVLGTKTNQHRDSNPESMS